MRARFNDGRDWFFRQRFGMFVHWGLYAIPAWHEQILWRGNVTRKEYERYAGEFNPVRFDPEQWLDVLQAAGMEYLCFTTKHHDGFCLWATHATDYNVMNTPYGKDVLAQLAAACRRRGVRLGLYYSLPDWHHPNYPNRGRHHEMFGPRPGDDPDEGKYLEFVRKQVEELCTQYGEISEFFWDVNVAEFHDPTLNDLIRSNQPNALINDRGPGPGDYSTPERHVPDGMEFSRPTEACQSMGRESWGYRDGEDYYTTKFLMQTMDRVFAMGGNYLLNVGPKADGSLPRECVTGLGRIGQWYAKVKEAFGDALPCTSMISTAETHLFRYDQVLLTRRANALYVHICNDPQTTGIVLEGLDRAPERATLLNDGRPVPFVVDVIPWRWKQRPCLRLADLPADEFLGEPMVVKLTFPESVAE